MITLVVVNGGADGILHKFILIEFELRMRQLMNF